MTVFEKKKYLSLFVAALMCMSLLTLAACSSGGQQSSSSAASSSESASSSAAAPEPNVTYGDKSSTSKSLLLTNKVGAPIINVAVLEAGSTAEPVFLMDEKEMWADGDLAEINFDSAASGLYDIYLTIGDQNYVLHNFDLADVENVEVMLEGDVAYVTLDRDGNAVSSLADETEIHDAAVAAAEAAAAEAEAAEQYVEEYVEEYTYYEEPAPTYNAPAPTYDAPAQTEDSCVEGGVVLR